MRWVFLLAQTFLERRRKYLSIGPAAFVGAFFLAVGLAGCSTGSSSSDTETVTGKISGVAAAGFLNGNREGPLTFPTLTFTGPVATSASNATIDSSTGQTIATSAGDFAVTVSLRRKPRTLPTWTGEHNGMCTFTVNAARVGNYLLDGSRSTGKFAGASGNGSYSISILGAAPLLAGKTACTSGDTGPVVAEGATISFRAVGPLAPKSS